MLTINWIWCRQIDFELRDFVGIGSLPQLNKICHR
jgi:hypothetical protein